jgi:hypothetical protein
MRRGAQTPWRVGSKALAIALAIADWRFRLDSG